MKLFTALMSCIIATQLCISPFACAGTISYTPGGSEDNASIEGDVSVQKIGNVSGPGGKVTIKGDTIVFSTDENEVVGDVSNNRRQRKIRLAGGVFNTRLVGTGKSTKCEGFAFFHEGSDLGKLEAGQPQDVVHLTNGTTCNGHITSISNSQTQVDTSTGPRVLNTSSIEKISSCRVYSFTMPLTATSNMSSNTSFVADSTVISFAPTNHGTTLRSQVNTQSTKVVSTTSKTGRSVFGGKMTWKKALICTLLLCGIATAIAVPIAVGCSGHHHHNNANQQAELFNLLRGRTASTGHID